MSDINISVQGGSSKRLLTAGKRCDRNILVTATGGVNEEINITSNGTYNAPEGVGYSPVIVNVPQDGSPPDEAFVISGTCKYRFAYTNWNWFLENYRDRITFEDITDLEYAFYNNSKLTEIPFTINLKYATTLNSAFNGMNQLKVCPKVRGTTVCADSSVQFDCLTNTYRLRDIEDLFTSDMIEEYSKKLCNSAYNIGKPTVFQNCHSLRKIPSWWYKFRLNEESTAMPSSSNIYNYGFYNCYVLDEATNIPVWRCKGAATSNIFANTTVNAYHLKDFTFETNNGQPIEVNWKNQTLSLTGIGYMSSKFGSGATNFLNYNSGITADKEVKDDATYQALKNDPDWFTVNGAYSRYDHDSAVRTINSLPDASAYLATAGGTNTIRFTGTAGELTDGGAINTLTAEEIAVAAAKGWTVTLV